MKTPEKPMRRAGDQPPLVSRCLLSIAQKMLSSGELAAWLRLFSEWRISHYHRQGLRLIRHRSLSRPERINLGSGTVRKNGYLNIDLFPGGDLTLDLRRGLPFEPDCCETIFSEHFLEHLDYPEPVSRLLSDYLRPQRELDAALGQRSPNDFKLAPRITERNTGCEW